jgi:hypothetical protein
MTSIDALPFAAASAFPKSLYIATIAVFAAFIVPTVHVWRKHGSPGFLGYNLLFTFCGVRLAGAALTLATFDGKHKNLETPASIINSMAISPLILTALGILHEARKARDLMVKERREWTHILLFHGIVIAGIALLIVGIVNLINGKTKTAPNKSVDIIVGLSLLCLSYVILVGWTILSMRTPTHRSSATSQDGTKVCPLPRYCIMRGI